MGAPLLIAVSHFWLPLGRQFVLLAFGFEHYSETAIKKFHPLWLCEGV